MKPLSAPFASLAPIALLTLAAMPAQAAEAEAEAAETAAETEATAKPAPPPAAPVSLAFTKPVYDETWATIGLGAGLVPSYAGSDDYIAFPLPLVVGRVGGIGIRPNGAGLTFDVLSAKPTLGKRKTRLAFGPMTAISRSTTTWSKRQASSTRRSKSGSMPRCPSPAC